jgi:hypothetical protein
LKKAAIFFFFLFCFWASAYGGEMSNALRSMEKLGAKTRVGILYRSYLDLLGDTRFEVDQFLKTQEAKANPEIAQRVEKIMGHYQNAAEFWGWSMWYPAGIMGKQDINPKLTQPEKNMIERDNRRVDRVLALYPGAHKRIEDGGIIINTSMPSIHLGAAIGGIWAEANQELADLKKMIEEK